eukprot:2099960-Pyramimonas_sp.AAC.1
MGQAAGCAPIASTSPALRACPAARGHRFARGARCDRAAATRALSLRAGEVHSTAVAASWRRSTTRSALGPGRQRRKYKPELWARWNFVSAARAGGNPSR